MKTFALEQPIGLQLACIGSRSTINYGTNTTIKFGRNRYNEYFDVANIKYYDAILGMPFLRKLGITLDFSFKKATKYILLLYSADEYNTRWQHISEDCVRPVFYFGGPRLRALGVNHAIGAVPRGWLSDEGA
jgi:hypothetical protein